MRKHLQKGLLLVLSVMLLAGCGNEEVQGSVAPKETKENETVVAETTAAEAENDYVSIGGFDGGVYTNKYLGIGCSLDEDWQFYSAEELQVMPDAVKDLFEGSDISEYLDEDVTQIMDMMAENVNDLTTMNLLLTRLSLQERLAYKTMTEEEIVDGILSASDLLISSYAQAGMDVSEMYKETVSFLGEEHTALKMKCVTEGVDVYMVQLSFYQVGSYGATLTLTSYLEDNTDELLALFYEIK